MNIDTFLHHLHFEPEKLFPYNWQVNWEDAPFPYKIYRSLSQISLSSEVPLLLSAQAQARSQNPDLLEVGHFLWYIYGLTQCAQSAYSGAASEKDITTKQSLRRFVPSGGALYPNELYLYLKLKDLPHGIYHYTVPHHSIALLREGNYDAYLADSLGQIGDLSGCFGVLFISTVFWKNFYKYHNFSYRLQGLDAGVLIGQTLEVAERMGFSSRVCYQFLDSAINHLLGFNEQDENVYAMIPLSIQQLVSSTDGRKRMRVTADSLCKDLKELNHETIQRSKRVLDYPMIRRINEEAKFDSTECFVQLENEDTPLFSSESEKVLLPVADPPEYDLKAVCKKRFSPDADFIMEKVTQSQLAVLLKETFNSSAYHNDLDVGEGKLDSRYSLYGCFYNVDSLPIGAYAYDNRTHALRRIAPGDHRGYLQNGLTMDNVNLFQVPLIFHIVGDKGHLLGKLGYRGYRIQQMEAGILVQRILLSAGAIGIGGHPLLGFDVKASDALFQMDAGQLTSLIQIPVGPFRPRAWLKAGLHN